MNVFTQWRELLTCKNKFLPPLEFSPAGHIFITVIDVWPWPGANREMGTNNLTAIEVTLSELCCSYKYMFIWLIYIDKCVFMIDNSWEGGWFFIFQLFIVFVNQISLYFFNLWKNTNKLCLLWLYFDKDSLGHLDFFLSCPPYFFPYSCLSSYLLHCFFILFHSCCFYEWVLLTRVQEFLISYSHTEWCLLFSDCVTTSAQCLFGAKN